MLYSQNILYFISLVVLQTLLKSYQHLKQVLCPIQLFPDHVIHWQLQVTTASIRQNFRLLAKLTTLVSLKSWLTPERCQIKLGNKHNTFLTDDPDKIEEEEWTGDRERWTTGEQGKIVSKDEGNQTRGQRISQEASRNILTELTYLGTADTGPRRLKYHCFPYSMFGQQKKMIPNMLVQHIWVAGILCNCQCSILVHVQIIW